MGPNQVQLPDLTGKTAVVTGGNGGLGLEVVRGLSGAGAHVTIAARNQTKASEAKATLIEENTDASISVVELDLAALSSIGNAAAQIMEAHPSLDILVNNAGLMGLPESITADGFEMQFGVNHLGHWALTSQLLESLLRAPAARIVSVSSFARLTTLPIDSDNPHMRSNYKPWGAYSRSKLANYHFALGLEQQLRQAGSATSSWLAHPGLTNSDLQTTTVSHGGGGRLGDFFQWLTEKVGMSTSEGARSILRAATDADVERGSFFGPRFVFSGSPARLRYLRPANERSIAELWRISEHETGLQIDVSKTLETIKSDPAE